MAAENDTNRATETPNDVLVLDETAVLAELATAEEFAPAIASDCAAPRRASNQFIAAEVLEEPTTWFGRLAAAAECLFGGMSLLVLLAVAASIPIAQFLSLGYLLEVAGRIARNPRLKFGFFGLRAAAKVGVAIVCGYALFLPIDFVTEIVTAARLIEPGSAADRGWTMALWILTPLVVLHIVSAIARGGRVRHFLLPAPVWTLRWLVTPDSYSRACDAVSIFFVNMQLPYFFWLGVRGFLGGLLWLLVPVTLLAAGRRFPLLGYAGGAVFIPVLMYLPFLQTQFAAENRFASMFDVAQARRVFRRAPVAFWLALTICLGLAVPLFLLKIELVPQDAAWLLSLAFVGFMYPTRLATGWAYGYAMRRQRPRHWALRWVAWLAMIPVAAAYVLIVFFTQYTSWSGVWSLYEQHAFLLPVPYLGQ